MATDYNTNLPGPIATGPAPPSVHLAWAVYNPSAPNGLVAGQQCALQCDGNGNLLVNVAVGGGGGGGGGSVTQGTIPWVDNITQIGGASFALGQQLAAASLPVVLTATQITTLTPLTSVAVTNAGTFAVQPGVAAAGGASTSFTNSAGGSTSNSAKGSAGQIYGYFLDNTANAATAYFQFFNATSATLGSTSPTFVIPVPAGGCANLWMSTGVAFGTGIRYGVATAYNGGTAMSSACNMTVWYD